MGDQATGVTPQGLYFNDIDVGAMLVSGRYEVTRDRIREFADLSGDQNPLHTDAEYARSMGFTDVIAHGLFGISIMTGLFEQLRVFHGTAVAFLGIDDWKFVAPITAGDTVYARMWFVDKRMTSNPSRGVVVRRYEIVNQDGKVVQRGSATIMLRVRQDSPEA